MESTLNNDQVTALLKAVSAKDGKSASKTLSAGDHEVDFVVRVSGTFTKGEDYEQKFVATANPWGLLAIALSKLNGVTVESIVKEHLVIDKKAQEAIKERADKALQSFKADTFQTANGKVSSVKLAVEQIAVVDASQADVQGEVA